MGMSRALILNALRMGSAFTFFIAFGFTSGGGLVASADAATRPLGAVIAADFPDPTIIRVGDSYYASATSSAWAPEFPILVSKDLANWQIAGEVFLQAPAWSDGAYWAPELKQIGSVFYAYYTAHRKGGGLCVAVATSSRVEGPYQDHGPLVCGKNGSIDADPVIDERGQRFLVWKEDLNSVNLPTPIMIQPLSSDGTHLVGEARELFRNDPKTWEFNLVEGPYVMRKGNYWYTFYSGAKCCDRDCNYALGVARAPTLFGPWEKNPANPILHGNTTWKCPGHGSIVETPDGHDLLLYHAMSVRDSVYVGRQAMIDEVQWGRDGWPTINGGRGPGSHPAGVLGAPLLNEERTIADDFVGPNLAFGWQWPSWATPRFSIDASSGGRLRLRTAPRAAVGDPTGGLVARSTTDGDYLATAVVSVARSTTASRSGIAAYGGADNGLGIFVERGKVSVWLRKNKKFTILGSDALPAGGLVGEVSLRLLVRDGYLYTPSWSVDGTHWKTILPREIDGSTLPPWDLGVRVGLTVGGGAGDEAVFESFRMAPLVRRP